MKIEDLLASLEPFIQIVTSERCKDMSIRDDVMQEARIAVCRIHRTRPEVGYGYYVNSVKRSIMSSVERRSWTGSESGAEHRTKPIDPLRRQGMVSLDDPDITYDPIGNDHRLELVESHDRYARVRTAVSNLEDARERELVYLMYWADQSYEDMSKEIGLSKKRVSVYLTNARKNLKEELADMAAA